jgi:hypothetical protein
MKRKELAFVVLLVVVLALVGCGPGEAQQPTSGSQATSGAATAKPAEMTPQALGDEIGGIYVEAIVEVTALLADRPEIADVKDKVAEMKEAYVQKLVELGRKREVLSDADKATVDAAIRDALSVNSEKWEPFNEAVQYYAVDKDFEFNQLLVSFNIIGQYANFDLLKKQAPEEAERLGIK